MFGVMGRTVRSHRDLEVYQNCHAAAMEIYHLSKAFDAEERYALTSQVRRSSRSVTANLAEAWRKRRYVASFIAKITDAEAEAAETQVWLRYARECDQMSEQDYRKLDGQYEQAIGTLVGMIVHADKWCLEHPSSHRRKRQQ